MLPFFRRIRRSLIDSGRLSKYMLYAIGEIALVVIGILIALQVNNLNEDRKMQQLENRYLREITSERAVTRDELQVDLKSHHFELGVMTRLRDHLVQRNPQYDTLWFDMILAGTDHQAYPKTSAFENLKSIGLNIIRNDTLRRLITDVYQLQLKRVTTTRNTTLKRNFIRFTRNTMGLMANLQDSSSLIRQKSR